jgi:signal transduction histidine kinase
VSDIVTDAEDGRDIILITVPILTSDSTFSGALVGAIHIEDMPLSDLIKRLKVGDEGFAYLVDSHGRTVFHPDPQHLSADFSDRSYVKDVTSGLSGGGIERLANGERVVVGFAPIEQTGWGLIVREPWEEVIGPVSTHRIVALFVATILALVTTWLLWRAIGRIDRPIQQLCQQTKRLAAGEMTDPIIMSDIQELDDLAQAFGFMAHQITSYRAGLRQYLSAITQSQEDERRRIARELHDETAQNIIAIDRQLELLLATEKNPEHEIRLKQLQSMLVETVQGVRAISRNLRPLMLEDLGLIPALHTMLNSYNEEVPDVQFTLDLIGEPTNLSAQQELGLYRIAQEAVTNSRKHAHASEIRVTIAFEDSTVRVLVRDNGQGFEPPSSFVEYSLKNSYGLMGIQERAWALGGTLDINSSPGKGAQLRVSIPIGEHRE